jgi:hypothetical protein
MASAIASPYAYSRVQASGCGRGNRAGLRWGHNLQESVHPLSLIYSDLAGAQQRASTGSAPAKAGVDGGSVVAGVCP